MGEKTNIEWCDSTINPTTGCDGCELWNGRDVRACYAGNLHEARLAKSLPALYAANFQEVRVAPGRMTQAARWPDLRGKERPEKPWLNGFPRMIFVGDMGDFMSREVPDDYIENEIIGAIKSPEGSRHFWMLLTKQIRRLAELSARIGGLPDNCMAMTTATSQPYAEARIPDLFKVKCRWRGISAEPLLGPIDLKLTVKFLGGSEAVKDIASDLHLVIVGGESGSNARPSHPQWFRDLRNQCQRTKIPFFFKQHGEFAHWQDIAQYDIQNSKWIEPDWFSAGMPGVWIEPNGRTSQRTDNDAAEFVYRVGKARAGRMLDGVEWNQAPVVSR